MPYEAPKRGVGVLNSMELGEQPIFTYRFDPQEDMTAFELALIMTIVVSHGEARALIPTGTDLVTTRELDPRIARHFWLVPNRTVT